MYTENIFDGKTLIAMILRRAVSTPGVHFMTPVEFPLQMGQMSYPRGHLIHAHSHNAVRDNVVTGTQEVLIVRRGKMRVNLYSQEKRFLSEHELREGDVIFLACGGHAVEALEDLDLVEVTQGPYLGETEKVTI
jgi:quercetin dioxygenase-like cupin family protein